MLAYKTLSGTKNFKKLVHLSLQFLVFFLGIMGVVVVWKNRIERGKENFFSLHSWLGLFSLFLFGIQVHFTYHNTLKTRLEPST